MRQTDSSRQAPVVDRYPHGRKWERERIIPTDNPTHLNRRLCAQLWQAVALDSWEDLKINRRENIGQGPFSHFPVPWSWISNLPGPHPFAFFIYCHIETLDGVLIENFHFPSLHPRRVEFPFTADYNAPSSLDVKQKRCIQLGPIGQYIIDKWQDTNPVSLHIATESWLQQPRDRYIESHFNFNRNFF